MCDFQFLFLNRPSHLPPVSPGPRSQPPGKPDSTACSAPLSCLSRLVREFVAQNNTVQIKHVIQTLSQEFALSQHPHSRKGGLIGLAACSIALGKVGLSPGGTDMAMMTFALSPLRPSRVLQTSALVPFSPHRSLARLALQLCTLLPWHGSYFGGRLAKRL